MTERPLRFGLIGTGRIGRVHAVSIAADPDSTLAWVCDPIVEGARAVAERYGGTVTDAADELFASGEVDAVLVASPTPTHVELIERAVDRDGRTVDVVVLPDGRELNREIVRAGMGWW